MKVRRPQLDVAQVGTCLSTATATATATVTVTMAYHGGHAMQLSMVHDGVVQCSAVQCCACLPACLL